ncbi:MAG TPA: hypothetical protein VFT29_15865 [Gemmatimonadaceae bacterium]|nr:hypothetical protein [Gemmatimonadaceae bacterium]
MISALDVTDDAAGREAFHAVVASAYEGQPRGTTPDRVAVERSLDRDIYRSRQRLFVAFDGDRPVARIVARIAPQLNDARGNPYGLLGFFESARNVDTGRALFQPAIDWLRGHGVGAIVGPMDGDTWHRYRVNIGPFDHPPFPLEPWNPPYYRELWEQAGFGEVESYSSKWIDDVTVLLPRLESGAERAASHGICVRALDRSRLDQELAIVHRLSAEIFRDAFLYSPITLPDFLDMYRGVERFLDPDLVVFATAPDGRDVGFVFAYADPSLPAIHYKTIGVLSDWRKAGTTAALSRHVYRNAVARGLRAGNHALMRDDNRSQALDAGLGVVFRRYVLFGRDA